MILEFSIVPMGSDAHLAAKVARILDEVDRSGLPYQLTAMGTLVEGEWDEVMALVKRCHAILKSDFERVLTTIRIDDKGEKKGLIEGKVAAVEQALGRKLQK
jgi:uncharacterized protein (TIGR00106 family)